MEETLKEIYYHLPSGASFSGVEPVFRAARKKGLKTITRKQVREWLKKQEVYTFHKPVRKKFTRNRVITGGKNVQFQADLVDLSSLSRFNKGYKYLLTCIDIFSKYAWAIPLKTKTGPEITKAFKKIFKSQKPKILQTDKGTEFLNRTFQAYLKKEGIRFFTTNSEAKSSVVERYNRTLKTKMWKYFTYKNTHQYIDVLKDLVNSYNHAFHRSIQMRPIDVNKSNEETVWQTLYGKTIKKPARFKFQMGDQVRVSIAKKIFDKGYKANWSTEIFTIAQRIPRSPPVYRLDDQQGERIEGVFYEAELQHIIKTDDIYKVEKIVKRKKQNGKLFYLVKWLGWPDKFNSWVAASYVTRL